MASAFSFVHSEQLRAILERDTRELSACLASKAYKATLVLAGSIIESVLVDYFIGHLPQGKAEADILKMEMGPLLSLAKAEKVLSGETHDLSTVVKDFRNLIHPGREVRMSARVDEKRANVAHTLVGIVLEDLATVYASAAGYTADQALTKLTEDPAGSLPLVEYIADKMGIAERQRLFELLPRKLPALLAMADDMAAAGAFFSMHDVLRTRVPEAAVVREAASLQPCLLASDKTPLERFTHIRFFRDDLMLVDAETRDAVLRCVLQSLGADDFTSHHCEWTCGYAFVGRYITAENLDLLVRTAELLPSDPSEALCVQFGEATAGLSGELQASLKDTLSASFVAAKLVHQIGIPF